MKLKKKVFKRTVMQALSQEFGVPIAFSGYDAQQEELLQRQIWGRA